MHSGPELFTDWLKRAKLTAREAAKFFEWDETFIAHLRSGRRRPGLDNALKIERLTGISVEAWASSEQDKPLAPITPEAESSQSGHGVK